MTKRNFATKRPGPCRTSTLSMLVGAALMLSLPAWAAPVTKPVVGYAPTATPTLSSTTPAVGDTLTVASGFIDADGDEESGTTYQWQIEKTVAQDDWQDMPVAVTTYKVQPEDSGKKIRVGVIPATDPAITDPSVGELTYSPNATVKVPPTPDGILVEGYTFTLDKAFPTTGFNAATFQFVAAGDVSKNNEFTWSSNQTWAGVDAAGKVTFTGTPTSGTKAVTIKAIPKGAGTPLSYSFTVGGWYVSSGTNRMNWSDANNYCSTRGGQPTVQQLNGSSTHSDGVRGTTGGLWSEWGAMSKYSGSGFVYEGHRDWTSEQNSGGYHYDVSLYYGTVSSNDVDTGLLNVVCRQGL